MDRRSTQITLVSVFSIVALLCASAWIFLVYKSSSSRSDMEVIAQTIADSSTQNSRNLSTKVALNNARQSIGDINNDFITEAQIPDFIGMIERLARSQSVTLDISSISLTGTPDDVAPRALSLHLGGSATWKGCVDFMASLDAARYAIDIGDVFLSEDKKGWKFSIDIVQYVIK